ncbi:MAG: glycosyltransferase family 4 protein [Ornithinimicrobium sp.]|uniref:glycosyltransferase family 4 protein n=1 Tax=Ornithinimicrobium sp. TaxID=1977084 RepID=UPI003D9BEAB5
MPAPDPPRLVVLTGLPGPSGGTVYNTRLAHEWTVDPVELTGPWPRPAAADLARLRQALCSGPRRVPVLVDGMLACAAPAVVREAVDDGRSVWVLVHLPLPAEGGLDAAERDRLGACERAALGAATGVVTTSDWAAADLLRRYGRTGVVVAEPGTDPAPRATGSTPPCLLTVASFTPRKNHRLLVDALAEVADLTWTAHWVGAISEHDTTAQLRRELASAGLSERVHLRGPLTGSAMRAVWDRADLLLLPSWAETYGMVVSEALAWGLPALVPADTAAQQTLTGADRHTEPAGAVLDPGSPQQWAEAVHRWLTDADLRDRWRTRAAGRADELPAWSDTAAHLRHEIQRSESTHELSPRASRQAG